jgi:hypothetical protein
MSRDLKPSASTRANVQTTSRLEIFISHILFMSDAFECRAKNVDLYGGDVKN